MKIVMREIRISAKELCKKLHINYPSPTELSGHEDNIGNKLIIPILKKLGFSEYEDIDIKPQFFHKFIGSRREPDIGVLKYKSVKRDNNEIPLYGMVISLKKYGLKLTQEMQEKLAGYVGLCGAIYGVLTNGIDIIVIKPTKGIVEWEYCDFIPTKEQLLKELEIEKPFQRYTDADITYARRVVYLPDKLDEKAIEQIAFECHNIIRRRKGMQVPERLYEFSKLLVLRILDEKNYVTNPEKIKSLHISLKNIEELKERGVRLKDYINDLFERFKRKVGIFEPDEKINLDDEVIEELIRVLDVHVLWSKHLDILGYVYERFLMNTMTGQELGQFFTPRPIVDMMVKMIDPSLGEKILDPACGTGGFLISAYLHIKNKLKHDPFQEIKKDLFGIEIDKYTSRLAKINMWLHENSHENVEQADALDARQMPESLLKALKDPERHGFDVILTNPPFGAREGSRWKDEDLERIVEAARNHDLPLYEVAYDQNGKLRKRGVQPQSLFLELCIKALKIPSEPGNGGRLGIVIDTGLLNNMQNEEPIVRNIIRENTIIEAIIGLPKGTFKAYGSNVIPSILILRRKSENEKQGPIFRAELHKIGFVPAVNRFRKDSDRDIRITLELWQKYKGGEI